jgi:hypothetical protein
MYLFNLPPVCPIVLLDYVDQVHDKVNVQLNIGVEPHSLFRDSRAKETNTQVVTLYSAIRILPDVVVAALHLPEWNYDHSEFAIVRIVGDQIVSICAPDKCQLLMEIPVPNLDHDLVVKFGHVGYEPTIMWYTPNNQEPIGAIRYALPPR